MEHRKCPAEIRSRLFEVRSVRSLWLMVAIYLCSPAHSSTAHPTCSDGTDSSADTPSALVIADRAADCQPAWAAQEFCLPGLNGTALATVTWDDGTGEAIYVGGAFSVAGCETTSNIARWDGSSWSPLGTGVNGTVRALTVFDDGSGAGPQLYAGGDFTTAGGTAASRIARWDGSAWSPVGSGVAGCTGLYCKPSVQAFAVLDDGVAAGPVLYAAGMFTSAGGVASNYVAQWDGTAWSPLGSGMNDSVWTLAVVDDGGQSGPSLYAGGVFTAAGGNEASRIARWDGSAWSPLGSGVSNVVSALIGFDDGGESGTTLYAGGSFLLAGGQQARFIARWDGSAWSSLESGMNGPVNSFVVFDDGSGAGPALYAGGNFTTAGGHAVNRVVRWSDSTWSPLGSSVNGSVRALTIFDEGHGEGPSLFAFGSFTAAEAQGASSVARWNGTAWSSLGSGLSGTILALKAFDDGSGTGPAIYAGGGFLSGTAGHFVARLEGSSWSLLGSALNNQVFVLGEFDQGLGEGPRLYAGGAFTDAAGQQVNHVAQWDGSAWLPLGSGLNNSARAFAVYDDGKGGGPALYVAGDFTTAGGHTANHIARWDGTDWSPLGSGLDDIVFALTVFDDGSGAGPALYAGGYFILAGGHTARKVARWDGSSWSPLGSGLSSTNWSMIPAANALAVHDDGQGDGPALYVGGEFTNAGGAVANNVARWNGSSWSSVGTGISGLDVTSLAIFDDGGGAGPALYAAGEFNAAGSTPTNRIARWDGAAWSPVGSGMNWSVYELAVLENEVSSERALFAAGTFTTAGGTVSAHVARWRGCPIGPNCSADINADHTLNFFDIAAYLVLYQSQNPSADWNNDGLVNFFDLAAYLDAYNTGCP